MNTDEVSYLSREPPEPINRCNEPRESDQILPLHRYAHGDVSKYPSQSDPLEINDLSMMACKVMTNIAF